MTEKIDNDKLQIPPTCKRARNTSMYLLELNLKNTFM
jgi:hypothetical protein